MCCCGKRLILFSWIVASVMSNSDPSITTYPSSDRPNPAIKNVNKLLLDATNDELIFADTDSLHAVSLDLKISKKTLDVPSLCPDKSCPSELVLSLLTDNNNHLITCAANMDSANCWRIYQSNLTVDSSWDVYGAKLASRLIMNNNVHFLSDPYIFLAGLDNGISKFSYPDVDNKDDIKTSSQVEASFVSAHEFDDSGFVYFFYLYTDEKESTQPGVARVCKFDKGGSKNLPGSGIFMSFLKSQLVCFKEQYVRGKKVYYYYKQLESVYEATIKDKNGINVKYVYGIFTAVREMATVTAICRYRVSEITGKFDNGALLKDGGSIRMTPERAQLSRKCVASSTPVAEPSFKMDMEAVQVCQLYDSFEVSPVYRQNNVRLMSLVVDSVDADTQLIFAGSDKGYVYKIVLWSDGRDVVADEVQPFADNKPILSLLRHQENIYVGGSKGVALFDGRRCANHVLCSSCVKKRDPQCGWGEGKCLSAKNRDDLLMDVEKGDENACPKVTADFYCEVVVIQSRFFDKATLMCEAKRVGSGETPRVMRWQRNNQEIFPSGKYSMLSNGDYSLQELRVRNYTSRDMGVFECIVGLGGELKPCSVTLEDSSTTVTPVVTTTAATIATNTTANVSRLPHPFVVHTGVTTITVGPKIGEKPTDYFTAFIAVSILLLFALAIIIVLLVIYCSCKKRADMEDGGASNGNPGGLKVSFTKKYKMKRADSAKKELLNKKNTSDRVYKPTTVEMNSLGNGVEVA